MLLFLAPLCGDADCPVASLLAIITCFHTTINENVIYRRYGRSLMSYPRSGRRILQPFQFGKEDQLLSEKTTKSRLAAPNICYGLSIIQPKKPGPVPGQFPAPFFGRSLPYFHNNDIHKLAVCSHSASTLPVCCGGTVGALPEPPCTRSPIVVHPTNFPENQCFFLDKPGKIRYTVLVCA